ncbi:MAG: AMP-binding protein [Spirochaetales bacterium]|nr:AMP-binding protein [Spirochaetales bacterium]
MQPGTISHLYDFLARSARDFPDKVTFRRRDSRDAYQGLTFAQMKQIVDEIAGGLIQRKVQKGDRVALLCDSSPHWILADAGILACGCVSVPRGTDVTDDDILYILNHSESKIAIVMRPRDRIRLEGLKNKLPLLGTILVLEDDTGQLATGPGTVAELRAESKNIADLPGYIARYQQEINPDDLATLIYTSGTTGEPKGVMLAQTGWIRAIERVMDRLQFTAADRGITLLPPWHAFERALEYGVISKGMDCLFTEPSRIKEDLYSFKPTVFPSVPRIWESVYNGIITKLQKESPAKQKIFAFALAVGGLWMKEKSILLDFNPEVKKPSLLLKALRRLLSAFLLLCILPAKGVAVLIFSKIHGALGGALRFSITGGSALPAVVDHFLSAIGMTVMEGYGMTETSAVISIRSLKRPTPGTVGRPLPGYRIKLKNNEGQDISNTPGEKGTLWVKSDQILLGYYKRPELNSVVFDSDGFFDTGDLMLVSPRGELMFAGRAKDTIALAGGENVEPVPVEDRLLLSPYIDQVMVVGDDRKTLGALIVPHFDRVEQKLKEDAPGVAVPPRENWNEHAAVRSLFRAEILRLINQSSGFKNFEIIPGNCFYVTPRNFDPDLEMTRTLKMKRPVIKERFAAQISSMYR